MYRKSQKLFLYVIFGLCFLPFSAFAWDVTYPGPTTIESLETLQCAGSGGVWVYPYDGTSYTYGIGGCFEGVRTTTFDLSVNPVPAGTYTMSVISPTDGNSTSTPFVWNGTGFVEYDVTHIIELLPEEGTTTPTGIDVDFFVHAWIADEDVFWNSITVELVYLDQNTWQGALVFPTVLYEETATSTGHFYYSTSTPLDDGNYMVRVSLWNKTFGGLLPSLSGQSTALAHQFVVGAPTFIGSLSQNFTTNMNDLLYGKSATSTQAVFDKCTPWRSDFDILTCISGLLIPDKATIFEQFTNFKDGFMLRVPWGYVTRFVRILSGSATSSPPVLSISIPDDPYFPSSLRSKTATFDPWSAMSSTSILTTSDGFGVGSFSDVFMPYFKIIVYGLVIFGVVSRLLGLMTADSPYVQTRDRDVMERRRFGFKTYERTIIRRK